MTDRKICASVSMKPITGLWLVVISLFKEVKIKRDLLEERTEFLHFLCHYELMGEDVLEIYEPIHLKPVKELNEAEIRLVHRLYKELRPQVPGFLPGLGEE